MSSEETQINVHDDFEIDLQREGVPRLHVDVHVPQGDALGTLVIAHGFMGYKDYGMLPRFAKTAVEEGWAAIKFNFAHSGMSRDVQQFDYPEHFAKSTWNRQIEDLAFLMDSIRDGSIGAPLATVPIVCLGHSRGGASVLMEAGRAFSGNDLPRPDGIIALASLARCNKVASLTPEHKEQLQSGDFVEVVSNRTGQTLAINRQFLDEIEADQAGHDTLALVGNIRCPILLAHGLKDPTVPVSDVDDLAIAAKACPDLRRVRIAGGDHILNVPNPLPDGHTSPQLEEFLEAMRSLLSSVAYQKGIHA